MNRTWTTLLVAALLLTVVQLPSQATSAEPKRPNNTEPKRSDNTQPKRPNIIVILVDDMGFSDIGCYGSEISTPNIDALAAGGLRYTQFYNTARCCPTRAALLTGLYSHEAGVGHMVEDLGEPGYRGRLNDQCVTIAEVMRDAGYFTAMTGKWHVGQEWGVTPRSRGFERNLTSPAGGFYYPRGKVPRLDLNGRLIADDDPALQKDWYTTDLYTDWGLKFIDRAHEAKKPFFLYLAYNAPHFPCQAPDADIAKYRGKYLVGWDKLREERYARQLKLGIIDKAWPLSPRPDKVKAWNSLTDKEKDRFDHVMAIYAACVDHIDQAVGRLVAGLRERGDLDNTLILFMSDNGGNAEGGPDGKLDGDHLGGVGSTVFCGQSWATLENTPFRRYKHFAHEGGIATPLVVHWPDGIAGKNELRQQVGHVIDIMATCVDVGKAKYPATHNNNAVPPMEGTSLAPTFADKPLKRGAIFWEHEGNAAVRKDDWKLVRLGRNGPWELYDLKNDRTEIHDVAGEHPTRVKHLSADWEEWAQRTHVVPYPKKTNTKKSKE